MGKEGSNGGMDVPYVGTMVVRLPTFVSPDNNRQGVLMDTRHVARHLGTMVTSVVYHGTNHRRLRQMDLVVEISYVVRALLPARKPLGPWWVRKPRGVQKTTEVSSLLGGVVGSGEGELTEVGSLELPL